MRIRSDWYDKLYIFCLSFRAKDAIKLCMYPQLTHLFLGRSIYFSTEIISTFPSTFWNLQSWKLINPSIFRTQLKEECNICIKWTLDYNFTCRSVNTLWEENSFLHNTQENPCFCREYKKLMELGQLYFPVYLPCYNHLFHA